MNNLPQIDKFAIALAEPPSSAELQRRLKGTKKTSSPTYSTADALGHIAAEIVVTAIKHARGRFISGVRTPKCSPREAVKYLRSPLCRLHCQIAGVDHEIVLENLDSLT